MKTRPNTNKVLTGLIIRSNFFNQAIHIPEDEWRSLSGMVGSTEYKGMFVVLENYMFSTQGNPHPLVLEKIRSLRLLNRIINQLRQISHSDISIHPDLISALETTVKSQAGLIADSLMFD